MLITKIKTFFSEMDPFLVSAFFTSFLFAISSPIVCIAIYQHLTPKILSFNTIGICVAIIIQGKLWEKYEVYLFEKFTFILIAEISFYFLLISALYYSKINYYEYYIFETLIFMVISKSIHFGTNTLKSKYFKNLEHRKIVDNKGMVYMSAGTLIGSGINLLYDFSIPHAFIITFVGISLDNLIFLYIIYKLLNPQVEFNEQSENLA